MYVTSLSGELRTDFDEEAEELTTHYLGTHYSIICGYEPNDEYDPVSVTLLIKETTCPHCKTKFLENAKVLRELADITNDLQRRQANVRDS